MSSTIKCHPKKPRQSEKTQTDQGLSCLLFWQAFREFQAWSCLWLHMPRGSYNLFVFSVRFFRHRRWLQVMRYVFTLFNITERFLSATDWDKTWKRLCVDYTVTAVILPSRPSHRNLKITLEMPLWVPYDYLKSLWSFFGPNDYLKSCVVLTINVWCP